MLNLSASNRSSCDGAPFDYAAFSADVVSEAKAAAERIKERMRGAVVEVGADLASVRARLPHGQFGNWLRAKFGMTERTAQNYMSAAALAAKSETVSDLRPKTLYLLAAPSTPEPARQKVLDRLNGGEIVPDREVRKIVEDAKWQEQQEQRRLTEESRLAKLSPRTRQSRAQREAEIEREEAERARERADCAETATWIVGELLTVLPVAVADRLRSLLDRQWSYLLVDELKRQLAEASPTGRKSESQP